MGSLVGSTAFGHLVTMSAAAPTTGGLDCPSTDENTVRIFRRLAEDAYGCLRTTVLLTFTVGCAVAPVAAQDVVIKGGWLFDGVSDSLVPNSAILVRSGKILSVGSRNMEPIEGEAQEVQLGDGEYIMPGMFDLHAHYAIDLFGDGRVDETHSYPTIFLANGVTSTFPAGEVDPDSMEMLRRRIDAGVQVGPRIFNSGPYFGGAREGWNRDATVEDIYREVDHWAAHGVRNFKAKRISPKHLRALIDRAHLHGATVTGHLDSGFRNSVNPRDAILMGIDRIEHFLGGDAIASDRPAYQTLEFLNTDDPAIDAIISLYLEHHVFFDATLTAYGYFGRRDPDVYTYFDDELKYLTPYMRDVVEGRPPRPANEQFERIYWVKRRTVKAFYDAGGARWITLGTDHPSWGEFFSGFSVHRELQALVLSGIPAAAALKIATINGARALNVSTYLGTIEPGKLADLVVLEGNPLADIRNTHRTRLVMKAGRFYDARRLLASVEGTIGPRGPDENDNWTRRRRRGVGRRK